MRPYKRFKGRFGIAYHGNYVGPGWSAGRYQDSVVSNVPPVDEFDRTAQIHDRAYARGEDLKEADYRFYRQNIGRGWKRSFAAMAVGAQGWLRAPPKQTKRRLTISDRAHWPNKRFLHKMPYGRRVRRPRPNPRYARAARYRPYAPARRRRGRVVRRRRPVRRMPKRANRNALTLSSGTLRPVQRVRHNTTLQTKGVTKVLERGGVVTRSQCVVLGHATSPSVRVIEIFAKALVKLLASRIGVLVNDMDHPINDGTIGDKWTISYRSNHDDGTTITGHDYTLTSANPKLDTIAANWFGFISENLYAESYISDIVFYPAAASSLRLCRIDLRNAKVLLHATSQLKIQNRSFENASDTMESLENMPVVGRQYEGYGMGTQYTASDDVAIPFIADRSYGIIDVDTANEAQPELKEPQPPHVFADVKRHGYAKLDPGQLKTSTLVYRKLFSMTEFMKRCVPNTTSAVDYKMYGVGKFRFMMFEKQLDAGADDTGNVKFGYEHNLRMSCAVYPIRNNYTVTMVET